MQQKHLKTSQNSQFNRKQVDFLKHHLFMANPLPQCSNNSLYKEEGIIFKTFMDFLDQQPPFQKIMQNLHKLINNFYQIQQLSYDNQQEEKIPKLNEEFLYELLNEEKQNHFQQPFALYLQHHNCCLLLKNYDSKHIEYQIYNVSLGEEKITQNNSFITGNHPRLCLKVEKNQIQNKYFEKILVDLQGSDFEDVKMQIKKKNVAYSTDKDVNDPKYVFEWLSNAVCGVVLPNSVHVEKKIIDEVISSSGYPWRRSGLYQVLKYILHSQLAQIYGVQLGSFYYKLLMISFKSFCLNGMHRKLSFDENLQIMKKISLQIKNIENFDRNTETFYDETIDKSSGILGSVHGFISCLWGDCMLSMKNDSVQSIDRSNIEEEKHLQLSLKQSLGKIQEIQKGIIHSIQIPSEPQAPTTNKILQEYCQVISINFSSKIETQWEQLRDIEDFFIRFWDSFKVEQYNQSEKIQMLKELYSISQKYYNQSQSSYRNNPLGLSVSYMIVVTLYLLQDKIVLSVHPYLKNFHCGIPLSVLECLCLRYNYYMDHLCSLESYIKERANQELNSQTILHYHNDISNYYLIQEKDLQNVKQRIKEQQKRDIENKLNEFRQKYKNYDDLMDKYYNSSCEYCTGTGYRDVYSKQKKKFIQESYTYTYHSNSCQKCRYKKQANSIKITFYEKCLPEYERDINQAVFEIQLPQEISLYRNSIIQIKEMLNKQQSQYSYGGGINIPGYWGTYSRLSQYQNHNSSNSKASVGSTSKLFSQLHNQGEKQITQYTESSIIKPNGFNFNMIDKNKYRQYSDSNYNLDIKEQCTFKSISPYHNLQWALNRTTHTQNQVLCSQNKIPLELEQLEYIDFCSLRAGNKIQHRNLLKSLEMRSLQFDQQGVISLVQQALFEVLMKDEDGSIFRQSHQDLSDQQFVSQFITSLKNYLEKISENWQKYTIALNLLTIFLRLCQFTFNLEEILPVLYLFRQILYKWMKSVKKNIQESQGKVSPQQIKETRYSLIELSICILMTYDFSEEVLLNNIIRDDNDILLWIQATNTFFENEILIQESFITSTKYICWIYFQQTKIVWKKVYPKIINYIEKQNFSVVQQFIEDHWVPSKNGTFSDWKIYSPPSDRWLCVKCQIKQEHQQQQQVKIVYIQMNLINGDFLVNCVPVGALPKNITGSSIYQRVFQDNLFDVQPEETFVSSKDSNSNAYEFFTDKNTSQVRIRELRENGEVLELIHNSCLDNDLPYYFVQKYSHWIHLQKKILIFRPILYDDKTFSNSVQNYEIYIDLNNFFLENQKYDYFLYDIYSSTYEELCRQLQRIELKQYIHIYYQNNEICIHLPRFGLQFQYERTNNRIISMDYDGFYISDEQYIGTLLGMDKGLYLKDKISNQNSMILVPHCQVTMSNFNQKYEHQQVSLHNSSLYNPPFFQYDIDNRFKVIKGQNQLAYHYLAYLFLITSSAMKNPFNDMTGSQNSVFLLNSAFCYSNKPFEKSSYQILENIQNLIPKIGYYSNYKKQSINMNWTQLLPTLCQNITLYFQCKHIMEESWKFSYLFKYNQDNIRDNQRKMNKQEYEFLLKRYYYRLQKLFPKDQYIRDEILNELSIQPFQDSYKEWGNFNQSGSEHLRQIQDIASSAFNKKAYHISYVNKVKPFLQQHSIVAGIQPELLLGQVDLEVWNKFSFSTEWLQLYFQCINQSNNNVQFGYFLSFLLYKQKVDFPQLVNILNIYIMHSTFQKVKEFKALNQDQYNLSEVYSLNTVYSTIDQNRYYTHYDHRADDDYEDNINYNKCQEWTKEIKRIIKPLWPCDRIGNIFDYNSYTYLGVNAILQTLNGWYFKWYQTYLLELFLDAVDRTLINLNQGYPQPIKQFLYEKSIHTSNQHKEKNHQQKELFPTTLKKTTNFMHLVGNIKQKILEVQLCMMKLSDLLSTDINSEQIQNINSILENDPMSQSEVQKIFYQDLNESYASFQKKSSTVKQFNQNSDFQAAKNQILEQIKPFLSQLIEYRKELLKQIQSLYFNPQQNNIKNINLYISQLWNSAHINQITKNLLNLPQNPLNYQVKQQLNNDLCLFFQLCVQEQKIGRILKFLEQSDFYRVYLELSTKEHSNWNPQEYIRWIIFEIENDLVIRPIQVKVAQHMISKDCQDINKVMQLNMGEGKTLVITPILASFLSESSQILRITVLNSLFNTNYEDLQIKLGGILNQRVYTFPCSRDINMGCAQLQDILNCHKKIQQSKGIILTVPEHRLSFQLKYLDYISSKQYQQVQGIYNIIQYMHSNCRDILDESDEILHVKYQLLYTIGCQKLVDGERLRWEILEIVLNQINYYLKKQQEYGQDKEVEFYKDFFVYNNITMEKYEEIREYIVNWLLSPSFSEIPIVKLKKAQKKIIRDFILDKKQNQQSLEVFYQMDVGHCREIFLILRGLLSYEILLTLLQKRWRIEFGIHEQREKFMVVPYRAKDVPAPRAEFGHPDIAIGLTCLNYYYSGLKDEQLEHLFQYLFTLCDAREIYGNWVQKTENIDKSISELSGINMKDFNQKNKILFPTFRFNLRTINFWMNNFVFIKEAKQFPAKLISNPWDLAQKQGKLVTGFSGTNDTKYLLPLTIQQKDLPELQETNAKVMNYIIKPENQKYYSLNQALKGVDILKEITTKGKNMGEVLIDVGALMLDLNNEQVIQEWLKISDCNSIQAGIYFDDDNNKMVIDRQGIKTKFVLSPYRHKLNKCIVYLDDIHTRGTDFKFPPNTHGYVTLGLKLTKDKLVQACMRLRQLGISQTISFYAPHNVHNQILEIQKNKNEKLTSKNVLEWCIKNSIKSIQNGFMHWVYQGVNNCQKLKALHFYEKTKGDNPNEISLQTLLKHCQEDEVYDLKEFYGGERVVSEVVKIVERQIQQKKQLHEQLKDQNEIFESQIQKKIDIFMKGEKRQTQILDEEQERELEQEIEEEQERQLPNPQNPRVPQISQHLIDMVTAGQYKECDIIRNLNECFNNTQIVQYLEPNLWGEELKATEEFVRVTERQDLKHMDDYLRSPMHMIIFWEKEKISKLLLISPYEANHLISKFRSKKEKENKVTFHSYAPKLNTEQDDLIFNGKIILPHIEIQNSSQFEEIYTRIKVFSASLQFLQYEEELVEMKNYLGVSVSDSQNEENWQSLFEQDLIQKDCFVLKQNRKYVDATMESQLENKCKFVSSPLKLLQKLKEIRHFNYRLLQFQDIIASRSQ